MKDYQQQYIERAAEFESFLIAICAELPGWELLDVPADQQPVQSCRIRHLKCGNGIHELCAHYEASDGRICFSPIAWPQYTDIDGRKCSKRPNDLYGTDLRPVSPETRCKTYRPPESIARRIQSKVIKDYELLYVDLQELARSAQEYTDKTNAGRDVLAKACRHVPNSGQNSFYVREMPGESVRVEFNSVGDVRLHLDAKEAASVINYLRSKRNRNAK